MRARRIQLAVISIVPLLTATCSTTTTEGTSGGRDAAFVDDVNTEVATLGAPDAPSGSDAGTIGGDDAGVPHQPSRALRRRRSA